MQEKLDLNQKILDLEMKKFNFGLIFIMLFAFFIFALNFKQTKGY